MPHAVRLGTRNSPLALAQSELVAARLRQAGLTVELVPVVTQGDLHRGSLAAAAGTGLFVAALRAALLEGRCDVAVHSLKDLPTYTTSGVMLAATPNRADPRDALCARRGHTLAELPPRARVGTGSPRRAAQLRLRRPDLHIVDIRGNVGTRLARLQPQPDQLDAVVLAAAGLTRLGALDAATEVFEPEVMLPAPGQGALAVECREADAGASLHASLAELDDAATRAAVTAERAVLARLEAGCSAPVGALGSVSRAGELELRAIAIGPDGRPVHGRVHGAASAAADLGTRLADDLLAQDLRRGAPPTGSPAPGPEPGPRHAS